MLRINLSTGDTLALDIRRAEDVTRWQTAPGEIRALSVCHHGQLYVVPIPPSASKCDWYAGATYLNGELSRFAIACVADGVAVVVTVYQQQPMVRVDSDKMNNSESTLLKGMLKWGAKRAQEPQSG